jgi:predicted patatin/cPLA2 family phospholipase
LISGQTALVIEGGAFRSVFAAGLLDGFIDASFNPFDFCIGVSAGAACGIGYLSGRRGLVYTTLSRVTRERRFFHPLRFLQGGHLLDMDWLFAGPLAELLDPATVLAVNDSLIIAMTDIQSGCAVYHESDPKRLASALKASMSLPVLYRHFPLYAGQPMTDGGIADGIPVVEAVRRGAKHVVVIRSRHRTYTKTDTPWHRFLRWKMRKYPALRQVMHQRIDQHERIKQFLVNPPHGLRITDISPPAQLQQGRFDRNPNTLDRSYQIGYEMAPEVIRKWQKSF